MEIRTSNISDVKAISDIHSDSWIESYDGILDPNYLNGTLRGERYSSWSKRISEDRDDEIIYVAEEAGKILGFICLVLDKDPSLGSYVDNLHISTKHRSNGLGKLLLRRAALACSGHSKTAGLHLLVTQHNTRGQKFYSRFGAKQSIADSWVAPDGSDIPVFLYSWDDVGAILNG